ncbi:hypothetical protein D3C77_413940 [compost metagenome]
MPWIVKASDDMVDRSETACRFNYEVGVMADRDFGAVAFVFIVLLAGNDDFDAVYGE